MNKIGLLSENPNPESESESNAEMDINQMVEYALNEGKVDDLFPIDYENFQYVAHPYTHNLSISFAKGQDVKSKARHLYRYWDTEQKLVLTLIYWGKYIDAKAARNIIIEIAPKVRVMTSWRNRLHAIEKEFYEKNPDKRPTPGN